MDEQDSTQRRAGGGNRRYGEAYQKQKKKSTKSSIKDLSDLVSLTIFYQGAAREPPVSARCFSAARSVEKAAARWSELHLVALGSAGTAGATAVHLCPLPSPVPASSSPQTTCPCAPPSARPSWCPPTRNTSARPTAQGNPREMRRTAVLGAAGGWSGPITVLSWLGFGLSLCTSLWKIRVVPLQIHDTNQQSGSFPFHFLAALEVETSLHAVNMSGKEI